MPWLRGGTVSVTNGSTAVTGTNAAFDANARVGDAFVGPDGLSYEVTNVASATVISILPAYKGATVSGATYAIMPVQGYPKLMVDAFNQLRLQFGDKLAALGTTGNYDTLPITKGGTGRTDGRVLLSEVGVQSAAALYGTQGMYMAWNSGQLGEGNFIVNRGAGSGGYSWRSVNADNTASGPQMTYSYAGLLTVPSLSVTSPIPLSSGGTGASDQGGARTALGLGSSAVRNIDTSGANVPLLSNANSWSAPQTLANASLVGATSVAPGAAVFQVMSSQGRLILTQGTGVNQIQSVNPANSGYIPLSVVCTNLYNDIDGGANLGNGQRRWSTIFAVSGTINTSDAREKTAVSAMKEAEIQASIALAKEIGTFKWLASILEKGDEARIHVGMTVQRAIEIMTSFGLDAMAYAFICYDEWPAVEEAGYESIRGNIYSLGEMIYQNVEISMFEQYEDYPSFTWEETSRQYVITKKAEPAGNRYGFRYDQLALFIARGQEERLARLEALMTPAA